MKLDIRLKRFDEIAGILGNAFDRARDYSTVFADFIPWYQRLVVPAMFTTLGATAGMKWRKLSPRYQRWKDKHFPGMPMEVCTGAMFTAATGGAGAIQAIEQKTATFGIDLGAIPYARAQQYGNPGNNLPQRPYLFSSDEGLPGRAAQYLKDQILKHLGAES